MQQIPVLISIQSKAHRDDDSKDESISLLISGTLFIDETKAVLKYEEQLDESLPPQPVVLEMEDDCVSMDRIGAYEAKMIFRPGCRYEGLYHTPVGDMDMGLFCMRASYSLDGDGGEIVLSYQLDINGQFAAVHEMEIRVFRREGDD